MGCVGGKVKRFWHILLRHKKQGVTAYLGNDLLALTGANINSIREYRCTERGPLAETTQSMHRRQTLLHA